MSKTNDTSYDVAAASERELTEAELDLVAGGAPPPHYEFYAVGTAYGFGDLHLDSTATPATGRRGGWAKGGAATGPQPWRWPSCLG